MVSCLRYVDMTIFFQGVLGLRLMNLQVKLVNCAWFCIFVSLICKPQHFLDCVIACQFTRWIFILVMHEPQMKSLTIRLIISVVLTGNWKDCIKWVGMAERTDLAKVNQPAIVKVFVFQLHNLAYRWGIRLLKLKCVGDWIWIGKPR